MLAYARASASSSSGTSRSTSLPPCGAINGAAVSVVVPNVESPCSEHDRRAAPVRAKGEQPGAYRSNVQAVVINKPAIPIWSGRRGTQAASRLPMSTPGIEPINKRPAIPT